MSDWLGLFCRSRSRSRSRCESRNRSIRSNESLKSKMIGVDDDGGPVMSEVQVEVDMLKSRIAPGRKKM